MFGAEESRYWRVVMETTATTTASPSSPTVSSSPSWRGTALLVAEATICQLIPVDPYSVDPGSLPKSLAGLLRAPLTSYGGGSDPARNLAISAVSPVVVESSSGSSAPPATPPVVNKFTHLECLSMFNEKLKRERRKPGECTLDEFEKFEELINGVQDPKVLQAFAPTGPYTIAPQQRLHFELKQLRFYGELYPAKKRIVEVVRNALSEIKKGELYVKANRKEWIRECKTLLGSLKKCRNYEVFSSLMHIHLAELMCDTKELDVNLKFLFIKGVLQGKVKKNGQLFVMKTSAFDDALVDFKSLLLDVINDSDGCRRVDDDDDDDDDDEFYGGEERAHNNNNNYDDYEDDDDDEFEED